MADQIPADPRARTTGRCIGISRDQWKLLGAAVVLGGNVRAGVEDNLYLPDGSMCRRTATWSRKAREIVEDSGRKVATVAEARKMLGLRAGARPEPMTDAEPCHSKASASST